MYSFQTRCVLDDELEASPIRRHLDASEARGHDLQPRGDVGGANEQEALQDRAAGEQRTQSAPGDADVGEGQALENWQEQRAAAIAVVSIWETTITEASGTERRREAA